MDPTQRKTIDQYVQQAKKEGAEVYQACASMPSHGCFYPPTLITKVQPVSTCVQEEVSLSLVVGSFVPRLLPSFDHGQYESGKGL